MIEQVVTIRPYKNSDYEFFVHFVELVHEFVLKMDPLGQLIIDPKYGKTYADKHLKEVAECGGLILIAEVNGEIIGSGVGTIQKQTELLKYRPALSGRISALYIDSEHRNMGIGKRMIAGFEKFFKEKGCKYVRLIVFEQNTNAHTLYKKLGYIDRSRNMIKEI